MKYLNDTRVIGGVRVSTVMTKKNLLLMVQEDLIYERISNAPDWNDSAILVENRAGI